MNSFFERLLRLLFPPKCSGCGELLSARDEVMCSACAADYVAATDRVCPQCLKKMHACTCPNRFLDRHGIHTVIKLFSYHPHQADLATNRLIFRLKRCDSDATIAFLADRLAEEIRPQMEVDKPYVLTGVPRSKSPIRRYGDDHVRLLCRALSKRLHIPYVSAVDRVGREGQQKKKNYRERLASAAVSYEPDYRFDLRGKRVILVDDVVTSGATLASCAAAVRKCGARQVIAAVIGSSYRYRDLVGTKQYYWEKQKHKQ